MMLSLFHTLMARGTQHCSGMRRHSKARNPKHAPLVLPKMGNKFKIQSLKFETTSSLRFRPAVLNFEFRISNLFRISCFVLRACFSLCLLLSAFCFLSVNAADEPFDPARFEAHVAALCKASHRQSGTSECAAARAYIENELRTMGFEIHEQHFTVPRCETTECKLIAGGAEHELFPLRPNLLQASVTGPDGISGPVIYAGKGESRDFDGIDPRGAIVLLDFSQIDGGDQAFTLGAAAVIYLDDAKMLAAYASDKQVSASADLPRFFMRRAAAEKAGLMTRGTVKATVRASAHWVLSEGVNVVALVPGVPPPDADDEALVLACNYDTLGAVPALAPGARQAANCAALLETARLFKNSRPARTMLFAFLDSECQYHLGSRWLYYALQKVRIESGNDDPLQTVRKDYYAKERSDIAAIQESLEQLRPDGTAKSLAALSDAAVRELDHVAGWEADRYVEPISRLNRTIARMKSNNEPMEPVDKLSGEVEQIRAKKSSWNRLRYALKNRNLPAEDAEYYAKDWDLTCDRLQRRQDELQELETRNSEYIALGKLLTKPAAEAGKNDLPVRIVAHFSFNFSDAMPMWGPIVGGECPLDTGNYLATASNYSKAYNVLRSAVGRLRSSGAWNDDGFVDNTISGLYSLQDWIYTMFTHSGEVAEAYGYFGFCLMTLGDGYLREGLPTDTPANLNTGAILRASRDASALLLALGSDPDFGLRSGLNVKAKQYRYSRKDGVFSGNSVIEAAEGASVADHPAAGAIVAVLPARGSSMMNSRYNSIPGFDRAIYMAADANGYLDLPSVVPADWAFDAAKFDARGRITHAVNQNIDGNRKCFLPFANAPIKLQLFHAQSGVLTLCRDALTDGFFAENNWRLLNSLTDTEFVHYHIRQADSTLAFFIPFDTPAKLFGRNLLPILASTPELPLGVGFRWTPEDPAADPAYGSFMRHPVVQTALQASHDLWTLNESRLKLLRHAGLFNNSIEKIHGLGEDQLTASAESAAKNDWGRAYAHAEAAQIAGERIYNPIMGIMNDVIQAVIFLLALTIPFAFSLERLLIGSPNIYRQIGGFAFFFLVTFLVLYFIHPAFQLAATPMIIFLAFAIVTLSGSVIFIVLQKFQYEVRAIQGMAGTVHTAEVSRMTTMLSAVQMGISTMRRRPLRTTLTAVTVVLLTFTILCFASFSASSGVIDTYVGQQHNRPHMLIHNVTFSPMSRNKVAALKAILAEDGVVYGRLSMAGNPLTGLQAPLLKPGRRDTTMLNGVVALSEIERTITPEVFDALDGDVKRMLDGDGIFLSRDVLERMRLKTGDAVSLFGTPFSVAGTFDETRMEKIRQIDGAPFLPLDYQAAKEMSANTDSSRIEEVLRAMLQNLDPGSLTPIGPAQTAFISGASMEKIGGGYRAILVVPKNQETAAALARKIATLSDNYVYCGMSDGVHKFYFSDRMNFTGIGDLVVPLLLGGLIVFSTMLGSVVEREREIFTFSALGLAPPHIAMLFFAESCIYAVLGGLGGYLLGQAFVAVLTFLSTHYGIVRVPNVNYSSSTAIVTILIVMATVLLSTVYPAIKASRSANPGVTRSWKIPRPQGDLHKIVFPFTVSVYDMKGIVSFLKEHFDSHNDISLGHFSAQDAQIVKLDESGALGLQAKVWLAPFDLGVSQWFKLTTAPSEIPGIQEVNIEFSRLSGRPANWERFNRIFINDLRKQFLIWRALNHDAMENYRAKTDEFFTREVAGGAQT